MTTIYINKNEMLSVVKPIRYFRSICFMVFFLISNSRNKIFRKKIEKLAGKLKNVGRTSVECCISSNIANKIDIGRVVLSLFVGSTRSYFNIITVNML